MVAINPRNSQAGISVGGAPSVARDDGIGQGLRQLGGAIEGAGNAMAQMEARRIQQQQATESMKVDAERRRLALEMTGVYAEQATKMDPSGEGFTVTIQDEFNSRAERFLDTVPDYLRPAIAEDLKTSKVEWETKAAIDQRTQRSTWVKQNVEDSVTMSQSTVAAYPEQWQQALDSVYKTIDASGEGAILKEAMKKEAEAQLGIVWFQSMAARDPGAAKDMLGVGPADQNRTAYFASIRAAESSGNDSAKNSLSSATGRYQFIDETWQRLAASPKGKAAGLIPNGRLNGDQQEIAIRLFTAENEQQLAVNGIPINNANRYAAHFLGAGAAVRVLRADDTVPVANLLPFTVMQANPNLQGMTVGEFKAWASSKGNGKAVAAQPAPQVAGLTYQQRKVMFDQADAAENQNLKAAAALEAAQYTAHKDSLTHAIRNREVASRDTILGDPLLNDGDKATLVNTWDAEQEKVKSSDLIAGAYVGGDAPRGNPYNATDRTDFGNAFDSLRKALPNDPAVQGAFTVDWVQRTGMVPPSVTADLRQKLNSNNPSDVAMGLQQSAALYDATPATFDASDNGAEVREAATTYNELVNVKGLTPEQAAQRLIDQRAPENVAKAKVLDERWKAKETQKAVNVGDLLAKFDDTPGWATDSPKAGLENGQIDALGAIYAETVERHFKGAMANGDLEVAKRLAFEEMDDTFGVSRVSGEPILMAYNPEKFYQALPTSADPNAPATHDWLNTMALNAARTVLPTAGRVQLMSDPTITTEDVRANRPPRYILRYQDATTGAWDVMSEVFSISPPELKEIQDAIAEERRLRLEISIMEGDLREGTSSPLSPRVTVQNPLGIGLQPNPAFDPAARTAAEAQMGTMQQQLVEAGARRAAAMGVTPPTPRVVTPPAGLDGTLDPSALAAQQQFLNERSQSFAPGGSPITVFDPMTGGFR